MKKEVKQQTDVNTFDDLKFYSHHYDRFGKIEQCRFPNDYGLSVVNGEGAYCTADTFEVAILHNGGITYDTPLTNDVLPSQSKENINLLIKEVKSWDKDQY